MKKKVSFVRELQTAVGNSRQVFEMAGGVYAMHWMQDTPFTIIFPEELDADEWGDIVNPLEVGRCGTESPLITESNFLYHPDDIFALNWCIVDQESDEVTYLRLCDPQDATHVFVGYAHSEVRCKALSAHDRGTCSDLQFFRDPHDSSNIYFLMPVGYIRLSYENDGVTHYTRGINGPEELAQYYQERSAAWRQNAQEKLDAWRARKDQNAEIIRQAREFREAHLDELKALHARYDALLRASAEFAGTADLDFRQEATIICNTRLSTTIDKSHGWRMSLGNWKFDFSDQGMSELTERITKQVAKLETLKATQEERRNHSRIMREVHRDIVNSHIRVIAKDGDHTRRRINYQKIWAEVNLDTVTIYNYNHNGVLEEEQFSLVENREQMYAHLQHVVAKSDERWCKFRCKLEDFFSR